MFLNKFSKKLKLLPQAQLVTQTNQEEVEKAVTNTKTGKTTAPNGRSIEFYKDSWHIIGSDLIGLYQNLFKTGKNTLGYEKKIHFFNLQKGLKNIIGNHRPISLLNTNFKIFTKIITQHIRHSLGDLVQKYQYDDREAKLRRPPPCYEIYILGNQK